ncbi:MAG: AAA family ATPase [Halobacteriovoraceae bacterium]|nr:AAA family ATPase [Halobacteriovoraceae bacterium]
MKLLNVKIKNFRGYKQEITIPISDLTTFVGKNDAGKSTILEALEIFFNNKSVVCEKDDLNINADNTKIEISCEFSELPEEIVIDATNSTTLTSEYLLNSNGNLEIKKIFSATAAKPKEKVYIICNHPSIRQGKDLLMLKRADLRQRATDLEIPENQFNSNLNASMRHAIWSSFGDLQLVSVDLLVDKEDSKKVFESIQKYLPLYALFQSDRQSRDDDKEVVDPMKIAIQQALSELNDEIEHIKTEVRNRAIETANRTLGKLNEMSPELASQLIPEFKAEPKFESQFKLTIVSDDQIPINKRGSGIRRLILLNFFRAEAERRRQEHQGNQIIFAFEEPETSQHPDHQEMLINAFLELSHTDNSQILLTTHTPALAGLLPLESLRFVEKNEDDRTVRFGTEDVFEEVAESLGILPDPISNHAKAILLVEGKGDVVFVHHTANTLRDAGYLDSAFEDKHFAIIPIGGCGNIKHWRNKKLAEQFNIPYCVLLDSDVGTNEARINEEKINQLKEDGVKAYLTRKREPENYIHVDCLELEDGSLFNFTETCDAKVLIGKEKVSKIKMVLEDYWVKMSAEQIRETEKYLDGEVEKYEFTDMFKDFLSLVED